MKDGTPRKLSIYCIGPGVGESILLHLPCGGWGVVDCYHGRAGGTLQFLQQRKVDRLKFFCLTHPHADHYRGAYQVLEAYRGKIERVWRFPGFTTRDMIKLALATSTRRKYRGDPRARALEDDYLLLIESLGEERELHDDFTYRQIIAPLNLLRESDYTIDARFPGTRAIENFQRVFAKISVKAGPMLLTEEGGELINAMSVVLLIEFGKATVFLLGDAQGGTVALHHQKQDGYTVVKVAHHGSVNGLGAEVLTFEGVAAPPVNWGIVTPYAPARLPSADMTQRYRRACKKLLLTGDGPPIAPRRAIPGASNARVLNKTITWVGLEVFQTGEVRELTNS